MKTNSPDTYISFPDIRDYTLSSKINTCNLPLTYINSPLKIKSQGAQSTCVAHALASLIEFHNFKETQSYMRFSTDFIYGCRFDAAYLGDGMCLRDGLKVIQKYGDVEYSLLPGNTNVSKARSKVERNFSQLRRAAYPNRISAYYKIKTLDELKYSLYYDGPVIATMKWYKKSNAFMDGIYHYDPSNDFSYHAVLIIGWDKNNLIVQNSWGIFFGKMGLFYIPFKQMNQIFVEFYGVTDNITNVKQPSKTTKVCSPIINLIFKLLKPLLKI